MLATKADQKYVSAIEKMIGKTLPVLEIDDSGPDSSHSRGRNAEDAPRESRPREDRKRGSRRRSDRPADQIGAVEDLNIPFGQTDLVPAFLLKEVKI